VIDMTTATPEVIITDYQDGLLDKDQALYALDMITTIKSGSTFNTLWGANGYSLKAGFVSRHPTQATPQAR
jgi:hypothetical protein